MSDGMASATPELHAATSDPARADAAKHPAPDRNRGLDALRGISIVFVICNHIGIRIPLAKTALAGFLPAWLLRGLNWNGYEAVFLFFVLSGFLIARRSLERWHELARIAPGRFYALRASRILPTLALVVALLGAFHLAGVPNFVIDKPEQSLVGAIGAVFGLYLNVYEGRYGYLPGGWDVIWSLSIEEVFYLAFPLVCLGLGRVRWLFVAVLVALLLSVPFVREAIDAQKNEIWSEKAYLPGMSAIAAGVLGAMLAARLPRPPRWIAPALCTLGSVGIGAIFFAGTFVWKALHQNYLLLLIGSAASLVLGLHWQAVSVAPWRLRGLGWLCSCGRLSYEIYLFHMFVVFASVGVAKAAGLAQGWGWIWYPPTLVLSWLLGLAVARGYSQPCERWLRRRRAKPFVAQPVAS